MAYCGRCGRTSKLTGNRFICRHCRKDPVKVAWEKAQIAWVEAGSPVPCLTPKYMAARAELAEAHRKAGAS